MTILVALTGVLSTDTGSPIREGRYLFDALLAARLRVVIMADMPTDKVEHWLLQQGLRGHAGVYSPSLDLGDGTPLRQRQIAVARASGHVDLVVDSDPEVIKYCLEEGVPSMLLAHPRSMRPPHRPDRAPRTWDAIQDQLFLKAVQLDAQAVRYE